MTIELARYPVLATKEGRNLTATVSHSRDPSRAKHRPYGPTQWDTDLASWFASAADGDQVEVIVIVSSDATGRLELANRPGVAAIATDPARATALNEHGGFVNPYTFVPTPPRGDLTTEPGQSGLGDSGPAGPPSHARYTPGQWTGRLRLTLTTLSPLLLPDTGRARRGTGADVERTVYDIRLDHDNRPLLAATSLKGALRSAYEIITASRFGIFPGHDQRLAYRIPAQQGLTVVPAVVGRNQAGEPVFRLSAEAAAWVPAYKGQRCHLHLLGGLANNRNLAALHQEEVAARICRYTYQRTQPHRPNNPVRFEVWRVTHLAGNMQELQQALPAQPDDPSDPTSRLTLNDKTHPRLVTGRLSITGNSIESKHDERLFIEPPTDADIPIEKEHLAFWQSVLDAYQAAKEYNVVPAGYERSRHVDDAKQLHALPEGTLVYVTVDQQRHHVTGVHPVMIGRMPFELSPATVLDPSLRPASTPEEFSPADRVFGWVPTAANTSRHGRRMSSGYRGRLAVRGVRCRTDDWQPEPPLPPNGVVLAPLSTPKPTQFRFYAASNPDGAPVERRARKEDGYTTNSGLRGRKVYRWETNPDGYWNPGHQGAHALNGRHREYLDPGAPAKQTARHTSWVRPGVTFDAELFVDGLSSIELGALLWLVSRGEQAPLRLGAGKPLGFGVVDCEVDWSATHLWDGVALADGWRQLQRPAPAPPTTLQRLTDDFQTTTDAHPALTEGIASYLAAVAPVAHPVHYPRRSPEPAPESYEWFVQNERVRNQQLTHGWPLPHVRDLEPRLPYLLPADDDRRTAPGPGPRSGQDRRNGGRPRPPTGQGRGGHG